MSKSADMIRQFHKEQMDDPKNLLRVTSLIFSNQNELILKIKKDFCVFLIEKIETHFKKMSPADFKIFIQNLMDEK